MKELVINLHDFLKAEIIEVKACKYAAVVDCKCDVLVSFKAVKIPSSDNKIYVNGRIKGFVELTCSRCLRGYNYFVEIPIDTDDICIVDGCIDIGEEVRQLLLLEVPMKPLCSEDCLGICKICGKYNKKNASCFCVEKGDEFVKEMWKKLLNKDNRRK
jgi:uncharacterized protein